MKRSWLAILAMMAALFGAQQIAMAQGAAPQGATPPGTFLQTSPSGQTFLMVPNNRQVKPASFNGGGEPAAEACDDGCCFEGWNHCYYAYGGFMYLRARDSEVAYAVAANGPIAPGTVPVQVSPVGVLDQDYQPGFFVGFGMTLDECSSIGVQYQQFESSTNDSITTDPGNVVRSLVVHPSTLNAAADGLYADGTYDIRFNILDLEYRQLIWGEECEKFNWLMGVRIAQTEQNFSSNFGAILGSQNVTTDLDFYGAGLKFGLEYERFTKRGFLVYAKGNASFVPGEYRANYQQSNAFDPSVVDTGWKAGRVVTMVDLEVGAGWVSCSGRYRLTAGYLLMGWFNTVQTDEWIKGVQSNNFVDMTSATSFDGLMARFEARF